MTSYQKLKARVKELEDEPSTAKVLSPNTMTLTGESIIPFGKYHKLKTKMKDIPSSYLLWLFKDMLITGERLSRDQLDVYVYINDNMNELKQRKS